MSTNEDNPSSSLATAIVALLGQGAGQTEEGVNAVLKALISEAVVPTGIAATDLAHAAFYFGVKYQKGVTAQINIGDTTPKEPTDPVPETLWAAIRDYAVACGALPEIAVDGFPESELNPNRSRLLAIDAIVQEVKALRSKI
jgi:hypothetical protein